MAHPDKLKAHPGGAHKPELDKLSPAQIRVVCEQLLYTMKTDERRNLMATFPGLYVLIFPGSEKATAELFMEVMGAPTP